MWFQCQHRLKKFFQGSLPLKRLYSCRFFTRKKILRISAIIIGFETFQKLPGWIVHTPIENNPTSKNAKYNITIKYLYVEIVENILCFFILTHALETFAARAFISLRHVTMSQELKKEVQLYIYLGGYRNARLWHKRLISKTYNTFHPWQRNDISKKFYLMQKNAYFPAKN